MENMPDRATQEPHVEEETGAARIEAVVPNLATYRPDRLIVSGSNLAEPGDSGAGRETIGVARHERLELGDEVTPLGAGTHEAHLSANDVPELGDFVEVRRAQDSSNGRRARIAFGGPHRPRALFGVDLHRSKLEDLKRSPPAAQPFLPKQDRTATFQLDDQRDYENDRKQQHHRERRSDQVEETLYLF